MKNLLVKLRLIFIFSLSLVTAQATNYTATIKVLPPADTVGACRPNIFEIKVKCPNARFTINGSIFLNGNTPSPLCNINDKVKYELVSVSGNSSPVFINASKISVTASGGSTDTLKLKFRAAIDCSIIGNTTTNNMTLLQTFSDSIYAPNHYKFIADTIVQDSILRSNNIQYPIIADITSNFQNIRYLTNDYLYFYFQNTKPSNSGHIGFRFKPDSIENCGALHRDSLEYSTGMNIPFKAYASGSIDTLILNYPDTLIIRQRVMDSLCLDTTCKASYSFRWFCNYPTTSNQFCTNCQGSTLVKEYTVVTYLTQQLSIVRLSPSSALTDFTCPNDTSQAIHWKFRFTNTGPGAIDSVIYNFVNFGSTPTSLNYLTYIPRSSVKISTHCLQCTVDTLYTNRTASLCNSVYGDPLLYDANVSIKSLGEKDTVWFEFTTFKCSQENDAALLNADKVYNKWVFNNLRAISVCSPKLHGIVASTNPLFRNNSISSMANDFDLDVKQTLTFFPSVTDIEVPRNAPGDTAKFTVNLKGTILADNPYSYDYQLLGCTQPGTPTSASCTLQAYLKATIYCDTNLRVLNPQSNVRLRWTSLNGTNFELNPIYYNSSVLPNECRSGDYSFYFDLRDSNAIHYLNEGKFDFVLQACCNEGPRPTKYNVRFYLLATPNNCDTLIVPLSGHINPPTITGLNDWLPLSSVNEEIQIHCPGCMAPGVIAQRYYIERTSFGARDTNNNNIAEYPITPITPNSPWFAQNKSNLLTSFSSYGDKVTDYLRAIFQDGEPQDGYTYDQMQHIGAKLNYLQLHRNIPAGLDTLNLSITDLTLYIDVPDTAAPNCINCAPFGADTTLYKTVLTLHAVGNDVWLYTKADTAHNYFVFTFDVDSSGAHNLRNTTWQNATSSITAATPFTTFDTGQLFRLSVNYNVCGNFSIPIPQSLNDVIKRSAITNRMWMTGKKQANESVDQMLNDTDTLLAIGITLDSALAANDSTLSLMDSAYTNSHIFYCEPTGGLHYFFSQVAKNFSAISSSSTCNATIDVSAISNVADFRNAGIDIYPFEYRPPALAPDSFRVIIPPGYHVKSSRIRHIVYTSAISSGAGLLYTGWVNFNPGAIKDTIDFTSAILPTAICLTDTVNLSTVITKPILYSGDQLTTRAIQFELEPDSCGIDSVNTTVNNVIIRSNSAASACSTAPPCNLPQSIVRSMASTPPPLYIFNNLTSSLNSVITAKKNRVCIENISITNPLSTPTIFGKQISSGAASNVFIAVPSSLQAPYLSGWAFYGADTIPAVGNIIPLSTLFPVTSVATTGKVCASYTSCQDSANFKIYIGWNCDSFPTAPFDSASVCGVKSFNIKIKDAIATLGNTGKSHQPNSDYILCKPFELKACFSNGNSGGIYPDSVMLQNLYPGLVVQQAVVYNSPTSTQFISIDTSATGAWQVPGSALSAIGYADSSITLTQQVCFKFTLLPTCAYYHQTTLPDVTLFATSFCGEQDTNTASYSPGSFHYADSSICTGCFTLNKTANVDSVLIGDTVTFTIQVCSRNGSASTLALYEQLPDTSVFTILSSTVAFPYFVSFPADSCKNYIVTGIYKTAGSCPDTLFTNKVKLQSSTDIFSDSVCVNAINPCTVTQIQFADSSYATSYAASYTGKTIYIEGVFFVDTLLVLNNCMVYTNAGAQIIVLAGGNLTLNNTTIQGCSNMWRGINVNADARIFVQNNSILKDADRGITAEYSSDVNVDSSKIYDCVIGILAPPSTELESTSISVKRSYFGLQSSSFKPDFIGQASHGLSPRAGIEINNIVMTLGGTSGRVNEFFKMNNGIIAHNSTVIVKRSKFYNIYADTAYYDIYRGYAMVCERTNTSDYRTANLNVLPEALTYNTVNNCYRGIYAKGATLTANYIHLTNVNTGVHCESAPWLSTNMIVNCTITASNAGIYFIYNPFAKDIYLNDNHITIVGVNNPSSLLQPVRYAIYMAESPFGFSKYMASGNTINLTNANWGIYSGSLNQPKIKYNNVKLNDGGTAISINANYQANANCNTITGVYGPGLSGGNSVGISTSNSSIRTAIACNTVDSTYRGFLFGGANPSTFFSGNEMNTHFNGLYLNSGNTYIGIQPHRGNKWNNLTTSFGGLNLSPPTFWLASRFDVDSTLGNTYNPIVNPSAGWFSPTDTALTFYCGGTSICTSAPPSLNNDEVERMIAEGTLGSEAFADETRAIAGEYLYSELMRDSSQWVEDSTYIEFMLSREGEPVAYLYNAEEYIRSAYAFDSIFTDVYDSAAAQTTLYSDSISMIEELHVLHPEINYDIVREQWISILNFLNQTKTNLDLQREATLAGDLSDATLLNDYVISGELPEVNSAFMNDFEVAYVEGGESLERLRENYASLWAIAQQCPYVGGPAVERARTFIGLMNDSIEYDDDAICLQSGVYRLSNRDSSLKVREESSVTIKPNPANQKVDIILNSKFTGICKIEILSSLGSTVMMNEMDCETQVKSLDVSRLKPSIYTIKVYINNKIFSIGKIAIIR